MRFDLPETFTGSSHGVWKVKRYGIAECANPTCEHRCGTCEYQTRTDKRFDCFSTEVWARVNQGLPVFCGDASCKRAKGARAARLRKLRKERLAGKGSSGELDRSGPALVRKTKRS